MFTSVTVTLYTFNECGNPTPAVPNLYCLDTTLDEGVLNQTPVLVSDQKTIGAGVIQGICHFVPPNYNLGGSLPCQNVIPTLEHMCENIEALDTPGLAEFAKQCSTAVFSLSSVLKQALALEALCNLEEILKNYCEVQKPLLDPTREVLCGKTPSVSRITVSVSDPYRGSGSVISSAILGDITSDDPNPVTSFDYHRPGPANASCGPCQNQDASGIGFQALSTPWRQTYDGDLSLRTDYPCPSKGYYGAIDASSLGDAQAKCVAMAEDGGKASYASLMNLSFAHTRHTDKHPAMI